MRKVRFLLLWPALISRPLLAFCWPACGAITFTAAFDLFSALSSSPDIDDRGTADLELISQAGHRGTPLESLQDGLTVS